MSNFRNATCLGLLAAAGVAGLAAAAVTPQQAARLGAELTPSGAEKAAFEKVIGLFEKSPGAKGMKVSTLAIPYDAYADKISAAVPRGKGPDLFIYAQDRLGGWIEAGPAPGPGVMTDTMPAISPA